MPRKRAKAADDPILAPPATDELILAAEDLDGAPVFMAASSFSLKYELDRWPAIRFSDVKDYQKRKVA